MKGMYTYTMPNNSENELFIRCKSSVIKPIALSDPLKVVAIIPESLNNTLIAYTRINIDTQNGNITNNSKVGCFSCGARARKYANG